MTLTEEVMQAVLGAPEDRKEAALKILRGEITAASQTQESESFLTLKRCAQHLGISPTSLWRYNIPGHELGGRRKFRLSEVEAYLVSDAFRKRAANLRRGRKMGAGLRNISNNR